MNYAIKGLLTKRFCSEECCHDYLFTLSDKNHIIYLKRAKTVDHIKKCTFCKNTLNPYYNLARFDLYNDTLMRKDVIAYHSDDIGYVCNSDACLHLYLTDASKVYKVDEYYDDNEDFELCLD
jgi:hypothetical protein